MCILMCVNNDGVFTTSGWGHNPHIDLAPGQYGCTALHEGKQEHGKVENINISKIITINKPPV